jgi:predicted AlkP superfamily phosphohydrolase/phosphomutase
LQKIKELSKAGERLKELEFVKQFDVEHRNIRVAVEKQEYSNVLKSYKKLLFDDVQVSSF